MLQAGSRQPGAHHRREQELRSQVGVDRRPAELRAERHKGEAAARVERPGPRSRPREQGLGPEAVAAGTGPVAPELLEPAPEAPTVGVGVAAEAVAPVAPVPLGPAARRPVRLGVATARPTGVGVAAEAAVSGPRLVRPVPTTEGWGLAPATGPRRHPQR